MKNTHVAVQQKTTQHCKAIMLQLEIKNYKLELIKIQFLEISKSQTGKKKFNLSVRKD